MNSFVKPTARTKFGLAIASSTALAASPFMGLPAFAANITVDACAATGSGGQVGLVDAVNTANSTAGADIIDMSGLSACTITLTSALQIAESVTINGGDQVTLQQGGYNAIFTFASGVGIDFVLNDLVIDGMDAGTESGIDISPTADSTLTLNGVTMQDFDRTALRSRTVYTTLTINDSTFSNNYAPGSSAGIYSRGDIAVVDSTFTGNIARNMFGGAILVKNSAMTVSGSTFTSNIGRSGGALAAWGVDSSLTLLDDAASTFNNNSAHFVAGGAIYLYDGSLLIEGETAVTHTFDGNSAPSQGGAIGVFSYYSATDIQIDGDLLLTNNSGRLGGAVGVLNMYQGLGAIDVTGDITASGNQSNTGPGGSGGGVFYFGTLDSGPENSVIPGLDITFSGSTIDLQQNSADNNGGALYARSRAGNIYIDMTADQINISNNDAVYGGAIALKSFNSIDDATIDYANSFSISEGTATISNNYASKFGGAIYSKGFAVELIGGGGDSVLDALDATESVAMHEFASNRAEQDGGFLFAKSHSDITIEFASLHDNTSRSSALVRGIYSDFSFVGNSIVDNGRIPGPVVFNLVYGRFEAYANLFAGNRAQTMLNVDTGDTILVGNTFIDNYTGSSTILAAGYTDLGLVVRNNTFINNTSVELPYSAFIDGTYVDDPTLETITGNIFYSLQANDQQVYLYNAAKLGAGNLFNAAAVGGYGPAAHLMPFSPLLGDTYSMLVTAEQLNLTGLDNWANEGNLGLNLKTVGLGEGSVAIDLMTVAPDPALSSFEFDGRFENLFMDGTRDPGHGTGFDVGAFEAYNPNEPEDNGGGDDQPPAVEPNVLITAISKAEISAGGDTFKVFGRGLDGVSALYVGDVRVGFDVVSSTELVVTTGSLPTGRFAITAVADDGRAVYQDGIVVIAGTDLNLEPKFWTKRLSDGSAKIYASNVVGAGKVQFFVNGKEVAWVRAVDGNDPKLRQANGVSYLVRTVELVESGKTRLEVKLNGKRVRFTTYVN